MATAPCLLLLLPSSSPTPNPATPLPRLTSMDLHAPHRPHVVFFFFTPRLSPSSSPTPNPSTPPPQQSSMDLRDPAPAAHAVVGRRGRLQDLTAGVQTLRRQVSAERRGDAARCYLAVAGEAPAEEQLDRLVARAADVNEAVRAAMLSSSEAEEVEGVLVESQGVCVGDIKRYVAAATRDVGTAEGELREARRLWDSAQWRRTWGSRRCYSSHWLQRGGREVVVAECDRELAWVSHGQSRKEKKRGG